MRIQLQMLDQFDTYHLYTNWKWFSPQNDSGGLNTTSVLSTFRLLTHLLCTLWSIPAVCYIFHFLFCCLSLRFLFPQGPLYSSRSLKGRKGHVNVTLNVSLVVIKSIHFSTLLNTIERYFCQNRVRQCLIRYSFCIRFIHLLYKMASLDSMYLSVQSSLIQFANDVT